jgi:uncharacterized protein YdcH (DUF465 family)
VNELDLLEAVKRLNNLRDDVDKLDNWIAELHFGDKEKRKPVSGQSWFKVERAIKDVIGDILDEHEELEEKIKKATEGIEIN